MGDITLGRAFDDYKAVYMPFRNFADRTRVEYQNDLQGVIEYLEEAGIKHVKDLGLPIIERYVARLEQDGYASRTRKKKVIAIRSFMSFLHQEGYVNENIAKRIIVPFADSAMPNFLMQSECNRIREACASDLREKAIVELLLQTGIKLSELTSLTIDDIELGEKQNEYMRIKGRRGKNVRVIPLNTKAALSLGGYLQERGAGENNILFLNRFGEALGERGVQKLIKRIVKRAGIGKATVQTLRHTFGAHHVARGTDPKTVQNVMGLKDARSVAIYHALADEIVKKELQNNAF